ncbi:hypothetical protein, partial [uncultured Bacteroides sp.]|uniref:hypothetical protein n=1 Tax=uncultured Bacteroides sp. TaxID=162156 RepID=UPI002639E6E5
MSRLSSADNILAKRRRCSRNGNSVQPEPEQRAAGTGAACSRNGSSVQLEPEQRAAGTGAA